MRGIEGGKVKRLLIAIAALALVGGIGIAFVSGQQFAPPRAHTESGCAGEKPVEWYRETFAVHHQAVAADIREKLTQQSKLITGEDRAAGFFLETLTPRQVRLDAVFDHYGEKGITCWASKGDPLAATALSDRLLREASALEYPIETLIHVLDVSEIATAMAPANAVTFTEKFDLASPCNDALQRGIVACGYGVPEAFLIRGEALCRLNNRIGTTYVYRARRLGLWNAKSLAPACRQFEVRE